MKKLYWLFSLLLFFVGNIYGQQLMILKRHTEIYQPIIPPPSYLVKEGFEGVGYDTTNAITWTTSGTVDPDSTVFVTRGSENLALRRVGSTASASIYLPNFGAGTNFQQLHVFCSFAITISNATAQAIAIQTNGTTKGLIRVNSNGRLQIFDSALTVSASPATPIPGTNTVFYITGGWDLNAGSGYVEWASSSNNFVGSGSQYAAFTGGETGMKANQLTLIADRTGQTNYYDYTRCATNPIGNAPQ